MDRYRERLGPGLAPYLIGLLALPAGLAAAYPIAPWLGVVGAVVAYAVVLAVLIGTTTRVRVSDTELIAGRARLPIEVVGRMTGYRGADARAQRGTRLDARAWLCIRGWIDPVVKIELDDPDDPTPYWLVSTRRPEALIDAIDAARRARSSPR